MLREATERFEAIRSQISETEHAIVNQATAVNEAEDALTKLIGLQSLGEAKDSEVERARTWWANADHKHKGLKSAKTVLAQRLKEAEAEVEHARRAEAGEKREAALGLLEASRSRIQRLASELAKEIVLCAQLDNAARLDGGVMSGRALALAVGDPLEAMAANGIRIRGSEADPSLRLSPEPRPLSLAEITALTVA